MSIKEPSVSFEVGEVLELKGWFFKIVLVDAFTNKICLKRVSKEEAVQTQAQTGKG
ncbi:MAG: hypothetical protein HYZ87_03280 [Candidatus Omnitrophica bacterium]|nr:hypothetical protein [Candidatus Omnitrophota bacterium]